MFGDRAQDLADVGHHQDVCAAQPEDRIEKHVALGAVVDGQRVDAYVVLGVGAVDDATHVLCNEGLIADDDAFGKRLGAAGVGHLDRIFDPKDGLGLGPGHLLAP